MSEQPTFRPPSGTLPEPEREFRGWAEQESPEELARRRRWRIFFIVLIAGALLTAAGFAARPAYRKVKVWRSRPIAESSLQLSAEGKGREALEKARVAYQLAPGEVLSIRAMAAAVTEIGEIASASSVWKRVLTYPGSTDADRLNLIDCLLQLGQFNEAEEYLTSILTRGSPSAASLLASARLKIARNDEEGALQEVLRALELEPRNADATVLLNGLRLRSGDTAKAAEETLLEIAKQPTKIGLRALTILAVYPQIGAERGEWIAATLQTHPFSNERHRLRALELSLRVRPEKRASILDEAQERYSRSGESKSLGEFAGFLLNQKEPERVLALIPVERAQIRREWLMLHLEALSMLSRWNDGLKVLKGERMPMDTAVVQLYRSYFWEKLGEKANAQVAWKTAMTEAEGNAELLSYIGARAEQLRLPDKAEEAYRLLRRVPGRTAMANERLKRLGR